MKHYCNRQNTRKRPANSEPTTPAIRVPSESSAPDMSKNQKSENNTDEPVFPPGVDYSELGSTPSSPEMTVMPELSDTRTDYEYTADSDDAQGGSVTQMSGYEKQLEVDSRNTLYYPTEQRGSIYNDNMSGSFGFMSVPQQGVRHSVPTMPSYLRSYVGKYICLDLWTSDCRREEV